MPAKGLKKDDFFELAKVYEINWTKYQSVEKLTKYARSDGILHTSNSKYLL